MECLNLPFPQVTILLRFSWPPCRHGARAATPSLMISQGVMWQ
ncbi:hypothetical protein BDA96_05G063900 [Sorghum bicolor]|uniref:Uncharacterized protein n=1 Tax=Sorghum bicolor TaxID=4558 RepID=A0A921QW88_SORBI|nr:hypothetical protein BDA96_05G063900 [Sorghum bicolor]